MPRGASTDVPASDLLAHEQHLHACLRALGNPGWQHRPVPLAQHLEAHCPVRARGYAGMPVHPCGTLTWPCCVRP
jgi:hypothetical protein